MSTRSLAPCGASVRRTTTPAVVAVAQCAFRGLKAGSVGSPKCCHSARVRHGGARALARVRTRARTCAWDHVRHGAAARLAGLSRARWRRSWWRHTPLTATTRRASPRSARRLARSRWVWSARRRASPTALSWSQRRSGGWGRASRSRPTLPKVRLADAPRCARLGSSPLCTCAAWAGCVTLTDSRARPLSSVARTRARTHVCRGVHRTQVPSRTQTRPP